MTQPLSDEVLEELERLSRLCNPTLTNLVKISDEVPNLIAEIRRLRDGLAWLSENDKEFGYIADRLLTGVDIGETDDR